MVRSEPGRLLLGVLLLFAGGAGLGAQDGDEERIRSLEERVLELERSAREAPGADWTQRIRLSGSGNFGYFDGETDSFFDEGSFELRDARVFLDADLGRDVSVGDALAIRDIGFLFELNAVRLSEFGTTRRRFGAITLLDGLVGEVYADFQGILDSDWLGVQVGRFQLPIGESYLRYSQGYGDKPFVSDPVGGPWYWDEGVRIYGSGSRLGYVASVTDGENDFNDDDNRDLQFTLKLYGRVTDWLTVSVSGLHCSGVGSASSPALSSLWLGEMLPTGFGLLTPTPSFQDGVAVPDGPGELDAVSLLGTDLVFTSGPFRGWLAYGRTEIDTRGSTFYDRSIHYWIAELVVDGEAISDRLSTLYFGVRANGLGTYDRDEGYFHDLRQVAALGYNASSTEAYSAVIGWRCTERVTVRAEYTVYEVDLVRGVTSAIRDAADELDTLGLEVGIQF